MGSLPQSARRVPLDVQIESREETPDYVRFKLTYVPEAGDRVPALLLVPKSVQIPAEDGIGIATTARPTSGASTKRMPRWRQKGVSPASTVFSTSGSIMSRPPRGWQARLRASWATLALRLWLHTTPTGRRRSIEGWRPKLS